MLRLIQNFEALLHLQMKGFDISFSHSKSFGKFIPNGILKSSFGLVGFLIQVFKWKEGKVVFKGNLEAKIQTNQISVIE